MVIDRDLGAEPTTNGRVVELGSLVLRHLVLIIFTSLVGLGLGYLYFLKMPPIYKSMCSLLVRSESRSQAIPFQGTDNSNNSGTHEEPHALLIMSPLIVQQALDLKMSEIKKAESMATLESAERSATSGANDATADTSESSLQDPSLNQRLRDLPAFANVGDPVSHIIFNLKAGPSIKNGVESHDIVEITYRDADPMTTRAVVAGLARSYQNFLGESHKSDSSKVYELINDAKGTLSEEIKKIEADIAALRRDTPLLFHSDMKAHNIHRERMTEIENARTKIVIQITERRAELQSIQDTLKRGGSREALTLMLQTVTPDRYNQNDASKTPAMQLFDLMLEQQLLLQDLGPDHPKVKAMEKKIALTQDFFLNESGGDEIQGKKRKSTDFLSVCLDAFKHQIASLESKRIDMDELYLQERYSSIEIGDYEVQNENLQKELVRTSTLYDLVVKRLDELHLLQDYGGFRTAIISPATRGIQASPVLLQSLLIGAMLGGLIGFGLGYLAEVNDKTYRSPSEVSDHLGLPIVGHIPVIKRESSTVSAGSSLDKTMVTYFKPKSRQAEAYRAIRTSLYFSTRGEQHKVIQITSPNPGDGKTTLSANLAVSIAQSGKRVLLIDADFRRPRIHELLGIDKSIGMSSVINGDTELPDAIQATEVENLWGLACGARPNNPSELLSSRRFAELLDILREQYDFVLIDTPPVLAVTDPSVVAPRVDGVLVMLRLSTRTRGEAKEATDILASVGANTLGVVVNGVSKAGGQGYGYGRKYGYGNYESDKPDGDLPYYSSDDGANSLESAPVAPGRRRS